MPKKRSTKAAHAIDSENLAAYLEIVRNQHGRLDTRPYRQLSELRGAPPRLTMLGDGKREGVYVPLRFDLRLSREQVAMQQLAQEAIHETGLRQKLERELSKIDLSLSEVLAAPGHVVFIGKAGSGKTTVLRLVAAVLATSDASLVADRLALEAYPLPIPVYVALRDFEHACQTEPRRYRRDVDGLLSFIDDYFARWHPHKVTRHFLSNVVRTGRAWLLLDALDEVADFDHRIAVRKTIEALAGAFSGNRLLVTARVAAYASANTRLDERFHVAAVRDLTREQWAPLVRRLYAGLEADKDVAAKRAGRLLDRIDASELLQEMVKTPLMVWTATLIHYADRELPEQRAELYNAYVDVLLGERLHEEESAESARALREDRWSLEDRKLYLTYAAYQVHSLAGAEQRSGKRKKALPVVDEQDLVRRILAPFMMDDRGLTSRQARQEAQDFVAVMAERSGLLHARGGGYTFGDHLTVQEFLTASYLIDDLRDQGERWTEFLQTHVGESWWREVFLLAAGYLLRQPRQARRFLLNELGNIEGDGDAHAYGLAWAGRALLEIPPERVGWHDAVRGELAQRLVRELWRNPPAASVAARIEVGHILGKLGDPRFSGPYLLPQFMPIPAGRFWMGSEQEEVAQLIQETEKDYWKDELPRHEVALDAFALARYPTTNAMFERFIEAGGYQDARWWAEARAAGVWQEDGRVRDWLGDVRDKPAYWDDERVNGPNQPVVGVTWYEAAAYCRWLTVALDDGYEYRLPTEAEWERAARGDQGFRYPWGDDWRPARANSKELGLERTTPVGVFPDGASSEGLLDMAGNVWEWCSDWYDEDAYGRRSGHLESNPAGPEKGKYKVLRGGSWYTDQNAVRCAARLRLDPAVRAGTDGFRVARSSLRKAR